MPAKLIKLGADNKGIIPDSVYSLWHGFMHADTTLTEQIEKEVYIALYEELIPLCTSESTLPSSIIECGKCLDFDLAKGDVYQFKTVVNLDLLQQSYLNGTAINGQYCSDYPLTGSVLGALTSIKSLKIKAKQTIPKIALGYIGAVAIELSLSCKDQAVLQYNVVNHLKTVVDILINNELCRNYFDRESMEALRNLSQQFDAFLLTPHPMHDAEYIPTAVKQFSQHQVELVSHLFRALLILTEGGNKLALTSDYNKIARGQLENGPTSKYFHPHNPFQSLLKYVASFTIDLHQQHVRHLTLIPLTLPEKKRIETYIKMNLKHGIHFFGRHFYGEDAILYLLEQKKENDTLQLRWATPEDKTVISESAQHLHTLADWLRFHLYIADKIVSLKFLLSTEGQRWLARGDEATFIQHFIISYNSLLDKFKLDMQNLNGYLNKHILPSMNPEHGVLKITGTLIGRTLTHLMNRGVKPLLNIQERFSLLEKNIATVSRQFFADMGRFLNNSGYSFNLPITRKRVEDLNYIDDEPQPFPYKKTNTDQRLVNEIRRWVNSYVAESVNKQEEAYFLSLWTDMCLLKKQSALERYHECLFFVRVASEIELYTQQLNTDLKAQSEEVKSCAQATLNYLSKRDRKWQNLRLAKEQAEKEKARFFGLNASQDSAWSQRRYNKLSNRVNVLNNKQAFMLDLQPTYMDAGQFLDEISHRLMQSSKPSHEENAAFDDYLKEILTQYNLTKNVRTKAKYADIARGLMMLGANPIVWMESQETSLSIPNEESDGYFLAVEQTKLVLSHIENRAKHLGENALILQDNLKNLFFAIEDFADRLDKCVKSDNHFIWRFLSFFFKKDKLRGARLERAAVYGSAMRLISVILNEELFVLDESQKPAKSDVFKNALDHFQQACSKYSAAVPKKKWLHNMGTATFKRLSDAFTLINDNLTNDGERRLNYAIANKSAKEKEYLHETQNTIQLNAALDLAMKSMTKTIVDLKFANKDLTDSQLAKNIDEAVSDISKAFPTLECNTIRREILTLTSENRYNFLSRNEASPSLTTTTLAFKQ